MQQSLNLSNGWVVSVQNQKMAIGGGEETEIYTQNKEKAPLPCEQEVFNHKVHQVVLNTATRETAGTIKTASFLKSEFTG